MRFTVKRTEFSNKLSQVFNVAGKKTPKEILKNVKATVSDGKLTLHGTDEEVALQVTIPVEDARDGVCLLTPKVAMICREANHETISLVAEDNRVVITSGFSEWELDTEPADNFPSFASVDSESFEVSAKEYCTAVDRTAFATDVASTRYSLHGILHEKSESSLTLAATDGRRLSVHEVFASEGTSFRHVIPVRAARSVQDICESSENVTIRSSDKAVAFETDNGVVHTRVVEGRFPKYQDVIPSDTSVSIQAVAGPLQAAIRQAMIVTNEESRGVNFAFEREGNLTLKAVGSTVGRSNIKLPLQCSGDISLDIDPQFMLDILKAVPADTSFVIDATDSTHAVKITAAETIGVIMPLSRD